MAHFVGKVLHIRPSEILDNWSVPELVVAYGEYLNEKYYQSYLEYENLDKESKKKINKIPKKIAVPFKTFDDLE